MSNNESDVSLFFVCLLFCFTSAGEFEAAVLQQAALLFHGTGAILAVGAGVTVQREALRNRAGGTLTHLAVSRRGQIEYS